MKFCVTQKIIKDEENYPALLKLSPDQISDLLISYIEFKQEIGTDSATIINYLNSVEAFFEMNRKIWHTKTVRKMVTKTNRIKAGKTPATDDDVFNMINARVQLRDKAIIHYIASTGSRPGSIIDPPLQFKHLIALPDIKGLEKFNFDPENDEELDIHQYNGKRFCYAIKIYDESNEGYWAFLIPAASDALDDYTDERMKKGEKITPESYLFSTFGTKARQKYGFVTKDNLNNILQQAIKKAPVKRRLVTKTKYNKAQSYMFRKRFNGHLKMDNQINSNIAEKLMAHANGLDGTYFQPTLGECYVELYKAIAVLTPDPSKRKNLIIQKKDEEITELQSEKEAKADVQIELDEIRQISVNYLVETKQTLAKNRTALLDVMKFKEEIQVLLKQLEKKSKK